LIACPMRMVGVNPHSTHPMKEDVKKKHFSTPLRGIRVR
jgi:hypothetical protein